MESPSAIRLDKWLWAARFFKTRKLAAEAIAGGKVHLNNQRVKPGKEISVGARLEIQKDQYRWDIVVTSLNKQRRPAPEAALLYQEAEDSRIRRQALIVQQNAEKLLLPHHQRAHKPNKKDRRLIHRFKEG